MLVYDLVKDFYEIVKIEVKHKKKLIKNRIMC